MSEHELIILIFRKNSRLLQTYINETDNLKERSRRRKKIINLKHYLSLLTRTSLYNIIKAMSVDFSRFKIEPMTIYYPHERSGSAYYGYFSEKTYERVMYRKSGSVYGGRDNDSFTPVRVYDHRLSVEFVIEENTIVSDGLVLFKNHSYQTFRDIASAILDAKKREEAAEKAARIIRQEQEEQRRKEKILSKYS